MTRHKPNVLFLSTGNATRSIMAQGFLHALTGDRFNTVSAAVEVGSLNPSVSEVMKEAGIDISTQRPKTIAQSLKEPFGHVVTISDKAKERDPIFPFAIGALHWNIVDPNSGPGLSNQKKELLRRVRDEIQEKVKQFIADTAELKETELSIG
jgi:arsenate reductase